MPQIVKSEQLQSLAVFFICFILLFSCQQNPPHVPESITQIIDKTKVEFCPDRRLAVFDLKTSTVGDSIFISGEIDNPDALKTLSGNLGSLDGNNKINIQISLLPDSTVGHKNWGLISVSVANLRSKPGYSAELLNQVLMGTFVEILKKKKGWYYVRVADGYLGWMNGTFFSRLPEEEKQAWEEEKRLVFHQLYGKIYENPDASSMIKSDVVGGNILNIVEQGAVWSKVKWTEKESGYVKTNQCTDFDVWMKTKSVDADELIKTAFQFKGLPYLWGGNSTKGVDCSGFTQSIFKWNGFNLLRDASQQYRQGKVVTTGDNFENLHPGDLLFFGLRENKIIHVGLYLGQKEYMHSSGHVKINSFDSTAANFSRYRFDTFRGARRILN
ncbi:MAG: hypothetical protein DWQ05_02565 [Calditrichaeota bacterium]|nr:MAG: hypothetical protein DWQ05_02565 [Calditrichota bacterium]